LKIAVIIKQFLIGLILTGIVRSSYRNWWRYLPWWCSSMWT